MSELVLDLPAVASAFGRALHDAGMPVDARARGALRACARARAAGRSRSRLYWTARAVFVSHRDQVDRFDAVFAARLRRASTIRPRPRGDPNAPPMRGAEAGERRATPDAAPFGGPSTGGPVPQAGLREAPSATTAERDVPIAAASAEERLAATDFAELDAEELLRAAPAHARARARPAAAASRAGRGATAAASASTSARRCARATGPAATRRGGSCAGARASRAGSSCCATSRRRWSPTRARSCSSCTRPVGGADAEAFVFATRLTRLTRALRARQPDLAIERAAAAASRLVERHADRRGAADASTTLTAAAAWRAAPSS